MDDESTLTERRVADTIVGFTISNLGPIGTVHLPWREGLTVLYGANGAGKTTLLEGINFALTGKRFEHWIASAESCSIHVSLKNLDAPLIESTDQAVSVLQEIFFEQAKKNGEKMEGYFSVPEWSAIQSDYGLPSKKREALAWLTTRRSLESLCSRTLGERAPAAVENGFITFTAMGTDEPMWEVELSTPYSAFPEEFQEIDEVISSRPLWEGAIQDHHYGCGDSSIVYAAMNDALAKEGIDFRYPFGDNALRQMAESVADGDDDTDGILSTAHYWHDDEILSPFYLEMRALSSFAQPLPLASESPDWVPIPIHYFDTSVMPRFPSPLTWQETDVNARTQVALLSNVSLPIDATPAEFSTSVEPLLARLSARACEFSSALMPAPIELFVRVGDLRDWFNGLPVSWHAIDPATALHVSLDMLSEAQRRWATLSVELAVDDVVTGSRPAVVLIDEPELGLHRASVGNVAESLATIGAIEGIPVIVASHSSPFLERVDAKKFHVRRQVPGSGRSEVKDLERVREQEYALTAELGLTAAELLQLVDPFVVVEGEHDKVILEAWIETAVRHHNPRVVAMRGATNLLTIVDAPLIFEYTTANVVVVLDGISDAAGFDSMWKTAREKAQDGNPRGALAEVQKLRTRLAPEMGYEQELLLSFATEALKTGFQDRIRVFGFRRGDIIRYFDEMSFGLDADWESLWRQFQSIRRGGTQMNFKDWLRSRHHARIDAETVLAAYESGRGADLDRELDELRQLL